MNRNWTDKLQVKLFFAYISWKNLCSHTFKVCSEETIVMRLRKWRQHSSWCRGLHLVFIKRSSSGLHPANIHFDEEVFKTSWRRLSSLPSEDVLIKTNIFTLVIRLQKTFSKRLQDFLVKTNIFVLAIRFQDVFKTSCKNVFKTSSRRFQDILQICLQDVFKTYHQVKLFLLTCPQEVFNTFLRRTAKTVICRGVCIGHTSEILWAVYKVCESDKNFSSFSFSLYFIF